MNKIDEIKATLTGATPGPWRWEEGNTEWRDLGRFIGANDWPICWFGNQTTYYPTQGDEPHETDIHLIAKAPEYIEHLLNENDRLRKALEDVKTELLNNGYIDVESALQSSFKIINQALEPTKGEDTQ